jgi:hypothetical protein
MSTATATNHEIRDLEQQLNNIEREIQMSFQRDDHVSMLLRLTTDNTRAEVVERAVAIYKHIVEHTAAGGSVQFIKDGDKPRTLKVRLREVGQ